MRGLWLTTLVTLNEGGNSYGKPLESPIFVVNYWLSFIFIKVMLINIAACRGKSDLTQYLSFLAS